MKQLNLNLINPIISNAELVAKSILDRANVQAEYIIQSAKNKYDNKMEAREKLSWQINQKTWQLEEREQEFFKLCARIKEKQAEFKRISNFEVKERRKLL